MKPLVLIGGGGHCKSCIDVIQSKAEYHPVGIIDKKTHKKRMCLDVPVLGTDKDMEFILTKYANALITVGQIKTSTIRENLFKKIKAFGINLPVISSTTSHISKFSKIEEGTIIMHQSIVNAGAVVGYNNIINTMALIEHDACIGNHCHISTGALINGGVTIGDGSFVGSGAVIHQGIKIGKHAVISAGLVIKRDVADGEIIGVNP